MKTTTIRLHLVSAAAVAGLTGCSVFGGGDGTPSSNAVSIDKAVSQSESVVKAKKEVDQAKTMIDDLVGYSGYGDLASGNKDAWSKFDQDIGLKDLPQAITRDLPTKGLNAAAQIKADCSNLESLYTIASGHHDTTGADALKLYHRLCEDINYYFTNSGEEYGVSHIQGGYETTEQFIRQHK